MRKCVHISSPNDTFDLSVQFSTATGTIRAALVAAVTGVVMGGRGDAVDLGIVVRQAWECERRLKEIEAAAAVIAAAVLAVEGGDGQSETEFDQHQKRAAAAAAAAAAGKE